ncbi:MAG: FlgD immunoglobulin-like domain containing protein [Alphaproteobacteria bacterium]|nr:FlgD immunoglobulin-like domain containing protein [Alphaproteobacteria bacterium]
MAISGLSPAVISDPKNPSAASAATASTLKPVATASGNALNKLANDFDSFLLLLTTQLQNQNPLEPMDSKEFTSQLVQFTSVEQSIQSNKNLEKLIALTGGNTSSTAFNYIGREVRTANSSTNLSNGAASWSYEVDPKASSSAVTVLDSKGNAVFTLEGKTGAGTHKFVWDGKDKNGSSFPDGVYSLNVSALSPNKEPVSAKVFTTGTVTDVEISGDEPKLLIGGVKIGLKDVLSVTGGTSNSSAAFDYLGREIRTINSRTNLINGAANWTYEVDPKAARTLVTVKSNSGNILLEQDVKPLPGLNNLSWNGVDKKGDQQPDGVYSISVTAFDRNDVPVSTKVFTKGMVSAVDTSGNEPVLVIGGVKINLRDVLTVTEPAAAVPHTTEES